MLLPTAWSAYRFCWAGQGAVGVAGCGLANLGPADDVQPEAAAKDRDQVVPVAALALALLAAFSVGT